MLKGGYMAYWVDLDLNDPENIRSLQRVHRPGTSLGKMLEEVPEDRKLLVVIHREQASEGRLVFVSGDEYSAKARRLFERYVRYTDTHVFFVGAHLVPSADDNS